MTNQQTAGIYLHIPFCIQKCQYCDFCSFPRANTATVSQYVDRLCDELRLRAPSAAGHRFDTVYFGGGTPTLLPAAQLIRLLDTVRCHYTTDIDAEITLECNPATADETTFSELRAAGFNRLSIGAQSFDDGELAALGRVHRANAIESTVVSARRAGFDHISLDLMYGIPYQTPASFTRSLECALSLNVEHLSVYSLIVEEGTPFYDRRNALPLPDEDTLCAMTEKLLLTLEQAGYHRYEISNFARAGYRSRHNLHYWNLDDYLGFGSAAHSLLNGERTGHSRDLDAYLRGVDITEPEELLTPDAARDEYVMLRLRLTDGIDKALFFTRFGADFDVVYGQRAAPYVRAGLLQDSPDRIAFTSEGFDVSNTVLAQILYG
ncbi:MAG: radical SAM family heme chaperone HemW [Clostridia bacterium]|nr:radical SAM family heme chaperone HemW [Clostridia bacterium]